MTLSTTQSDHDISQDPEKAAQGAETPEEPSKFRDVPLPPDSQEHMTKARRIAISTVLVFCNSLLVRCNSNCNVDMLTDTSSSSLLALAWAELSKLESHLASTIQEQQLGFQLPIRKSISRLPHTSSNVILKMQTHTRCLRTYKRSYWGSVRT